MNFYFAPRRSGSSRRFFPWVTAVLTLLFSSCDKPATSPGVTGAEKVLTVEDVRPKAEQGNADAQTALGKILLEGRDTRPDYTEAARWFRQAAEKGSAEAQFYLASLYEAGRGVTRDDTEAVRWNTKAAESGYGEAQYALALLYATGRGTAKDKPASVKWFRAAAEQGLMEAQFNLAQRYQHGQGVETNLAEAYKWFALAAKQGMPDAVKECRQMKPDLSPAHIAEAEKLAASFVAKRTTPQP